MWNGLLTVSLKVSSEDTKGACSVDSTQLTLDGFIKVICCLSAFFGGLLSHVLVSICGKSYSCFWYHGWCLTWVKAEAKETSSLAIVYVLMSTHEFLMYPKLRVNLFVETSVGIRREFS